MMFPSLSNSNSSLSILILLAAIIILEPVRSLSVNNNNINNIININNNNNNNNNNIININRNNIDLVGNKEPTDIIHNIHPSNSSSSSSNNSSNSSTFSSSSSNRIFVAGISQTVTEQTLNSVFSQYGTIQDISIIGQTRDDNDNTENDYDEKDNETKSKTQLKRTQKRTRSPYCFISFQTLQAAQLALAAPKPKPQSDLISIYSEVRPATTFTTSTTSTTPPEDTSNLTISRRRRSNQSRVKEAERKEYVMGLARDANLILQVQSTHLDRLVDHLNHRWIGTRNLEEFGDNVDNDDDNDDDHVSNVDNVSNFDVASRSRSRVLGSTPTNSRNISLLFLSIQHDVPGDNNNNNYQTPAVEVSRMLAIDNVLARALNKVYIVDNQETITIQADYTSTKKRQR